jgi:SAM-dependent methyltransferase
MTKHVTPRQQKIAAAYDSDIWPLVPERAAELILRALPRRPATVAFEAGCATGRLTLAVAEKLDAASRILAIDSSPALIELADAAKKRHAAGSRVSFQVADAVSPVAVEDGAYDLALSNLFLAESADPKTAIADLGRCLKPGGRAIFTLPLRGCWAEFLDLYGDVLTEQGKREATAALRTYRNSLPEAQTAVAWLEAAGLTNVTIEINRWELLFKSAREFFFAPIIDLGPLPTWKQIAGGHGDEMQDVFFFVKEAIETYFSGTVFPVTMVIGCLQGMKPDAPGSG